MRFIAAVLLSVSSALAYQVISPGGSQGWTTTGPNILVWQRVDTDPQNFTVVLTNVNGGAMPNGDQVLNALVDGTLGNITCNPPSGGWPTGAGFRVNLVQDATHLNSILAQSSQFNINGSSSTTTTSSGQTYSNVGQTATAVASPTSPDTGTSPTNVSAALPGVDAKSGLFVAVAALTALIATTL